MLAPHYAEDAKFSARGLAPVEQLLDFFEFFRSQAVLPDHLRRNGSNRRGGHQGIFIVASPPIFRMRIRTKIVGADRSILSQMKSVIVGTAGHIDHGKTALVKALTGIDADRLEEEKRRGITIDIGFAHFELPAPDGSRIRLGFVDVPGHERFVRNMLAGVGGIDLVLLVVAADEGIKPQTREHFDICRLLAIPRGITVLTKSDAVDAETLEVVRMEVADYVRGSFLDTTLDAVAVSSLTGAGLDVLKSALAQVASEVAAKNSTALTRMPIDRVFTMKGFGTVVTGTLVAGTIRKEDELEVFPA